MVAFASMCSCLIPNTKWGEELRRMPCNLHIIDYVVTILMYFPKLLVKTKQKNTREGLTTSDM